MSDKESYVPSYDYSIVPKDINYVNIPAEYLLASEKIKDMITTLQAVRKEDFNLFDGPGLLTITGHFLT